MNVNVNNEEYHQRQERLARRRRRLELITVLQKTEEFPFQSKNKTDELVETFLENLKDNIHEMICERDLDDGNYQGLDSDRDTEAEVETVLRLFPGVLTRRKEIVYYEDDDDEEVRLVFSPIRFLAVTFPADDTWSFDQWCNVKSAPFIPLVARLAIEFGLFDEQHRGGLLFEGETHDVRHVLHYLMCSDPIERHNQEHHEHIDDTYLQVLIQLRKMGLLKKEDIQKYELLNDLSCHYFSNGEKRFRFLVEWDPSALTHTTIYAYLPIHSSSLYLNRSSIRGFQSIFEYGIHYFPKKKGINLLFIKTNKGNTPFKIACGKYGHEQVMEVVEDTLICYSTSLDNHAPPFNIVEALMMAAIDEHVHLDCVYFLIRREPDILQKLLSSSSSIESATNINQNKRKRNEEKKDDDDDFN
jgi:hypothetical protein